MPLPLVERSGKEIAERIRSRVESLKDVRDCHNVVVRAIGRKYDVTMHVSLDSDLSFDEVHRIASEVEWEVKKMIPESRVTVHTEPFKKVGSNLWETVREISDRVPGSRGVHDVHIQEINRKIAIDMHLEVSANMNMREAHAVADKVEEKLKRVIKNIGDVSIHVESISELVSKEMSDTSLELSSEIEHIAMGFPEIKEAKVVSIRRLGENQHLVMKCYFNPKINISKVHEVSSKLEVKIKNNFPRIERVDIHQEPLGG